MEKKKIVIAAANGFLGQAIMKHLKQDYHLIALVRKMQHLEDADEVLVWDGKTQGKWQSSLEGAYAVINLAGKNVNCRYNDENKRLILNSRLESTSVLGQAIDLCDQKPKIWMNSASATIYRDSYSEPMTEESTEYGHGFSEDVCMQWEKAFNEFTYPDVRKVIMRTTIVFGNEDGAYPVMKNLVKKGAGGTQGPGNQMVSWMHVEDYVRAVKYVLDNENISGPVNFAAPYPLKNSDFMAEMRKVLGAKIGLPAPTWLLEIGAKIIKTETELILKSRFVIPDKLEKAGFIFLYPTVGQAIKALEYENK